MKRIKLYILNWCMKHIWNAITEDAYLRIDSFNGKIFAGGKMLPDVEVNELASEANTILKFPLHKKILDSMKTVANEMMFKNSKNYDEVLFGKAVLWVLEVQEEKYKNIAKIKPKDFPKKQS